MRAESFEGFTSLEEEVEEDSVPEAKKSSLSDHKETMRDLRG